MLTLPFSRLSSRRLFTLLLASVLLAGLLFIPGFDRIRAADSDLVVHEWGTFTSVAGRDGLPLEWRPLTFESDLPSFVYSVDKGITWRGFRYPSKSNTPVTVRMETPVIYFYNQEGIDVSVKVNFPHGRITEWYPRANVSRGSIDWGTFTVIPNARVHLPNDLSQNHYYPARETDAAVVQVPGDESIEHEGFLFYRGVGNFDLPLSVRFVGEKVTIKNTSEEHIGRTILFENRGGRVGYRMLDLAQRDVDAEHPTLDGNLEALRQDLKAMLIADGLYEKEAEAMLNTWRDSWFEEGMRVFYLLPRKTTDNVLPITIGPKPTELVRVLVGRTELITPEMEKIVTLELMKLGASPEAVRATARKEMNRYGRFLEPILMQILRHTNDPQIIKEVEKLLDETN